MVFAPVLESIKSSITPIFHRRETRYKQWQLFYVNQCPIFAVGCAPPVEVSAPYPAECVGVFVDHYANKLVNSVQVTFASTAQ